MVGRAGCEWSEMPRAQPLGDCPPAAGLQLAMQARGTKITCLGPFVTLAVSAQQVQQGQQGQHQTQ